MNDLSPEARALLDLARNGEDPSHDDRARVRHAIAAAVAVGAVGASGTASAALSSGAATGAAKAVGIGTAGAGAGSMAPAVASAGALKVAVWIGMGVAAGIGGSGALYATTHRSENFQKAAVLAPAENPVSGRDAPRGAVAPARPQKNVPAVALPGEAVPPALGVAASGAVGAFPPGPAPSEPAPSLSAETKLLEDARGALAHGDALRALSLLDEHGRAFPRGALGPERLATRVLALCDLGRPIEARRAAEAFALAAPDSPLRARIAASCVGTGKAR